MKAPDVAMQHSQVRQNLDEMGGEREDPPAGFLTVFRTFRKKEMAAAYLSGLEGASPWQPSASRHLCPPLP